MKPCIRRRFGIWYCGLRDEDGTLWPPYGHGYNPGDALAEWLDVFFSPRVAA